METLIRHSCADGRISSREWSSDPAGGITDTDPVQISAAPGGYRIVDGSLRDNELSSDGKLKSSSALPFNESGTVVAVFPEADGGYKLAIADASGILENYTVPLSLERIDSHGQRDGSFNKDKLQLLLPDGISGAAVPRRENWLSPAVGRMIPAGPT